MLAPSWQRWCLRNLAFSATVAGGFVLAGLAAAGSSSLSGQATAVDGDTIIVAGERVRLFGIDAPERAQWCFHGRVPWACGERATEALRALLMQGPVSCGVRDHDRYGRAVAVCVGPAGDVAEQMVRQGMAVDWPQYDKASRYKPAEEEAVRNSAGVWSGDFDLPWIWRARHRR